ncbi:hypothetical protein BDW74DRAFT_106181 [Aspergillus multicolor]|uniref:uncharacterized protein n=1 Tax=Aspergillus multicolor TaxID=41759 RepID=UPI003CCE3ECF
MFRGPWRDAATSTITLDQDNIAAMEVMFHGLHHTLKTRGPNSVLMVTVWHLLLACDKYQVDYVTGPLKEWFKGWFEVENTSTEYGIKCEFERQVMLPCYQFNYAEGFAKATKWLVYNSEYRILELLSNNSTSELRRLHLPPRIIQQLDAARGRLRNILHNGLFDPVAKILDEGRCGCMESTLFDYLKELRRVKVWPLENAFRHASINDILQNLQRFDASHIRPPGQHEEGCFCHTNWRNIAIRAAQRVRDYFDGMCLSCISVTKCLVEGRDPDHEYWKSGENKKWDAHCCISHGQPTWYFSFIGRRERRTMTSY